MIASVSVAYLDERATAAKVLNCDLKLAFSGDPEAVRNSVDREVSGDVALQRNALLRERALRAADAGLIQESIGHMQEALRVLKHSPAMAASPAVRAEARKQEEMNSSFVRTVRDAVEYNRARKQIKGGNYQLLNSQMFRQ